MVLRLRPHYIFHYSKQPQGVLFAPTVGGGAACVLMGYMCSPNEANKIHPGTFQVKKIGGGWSPPHPSWYHNLDCTGASGTWETKSEDASCVSFRNAWKSNMLLQKWYWTVSDLKRAICKYTCFFWPETEYCMVLIQSGGKNTWTGRLPKLMNVNNQISNYLFYPLDSSVQTNRVW